MIFCRVERLRGVYLIQGIAREIILGQVGNDDGVGDDKKARFYPGPLLLVD